MSEQISWTHEQLRKRAIQWLTNTAHCGVVLSEVVSYAGEIPDAIGWKNTGSILVECKTSRADFHAQKEKLCMAHPGSGAGRERYFLVPEKLVRPDEVPLGWGLLYAFEKRVWVAAYPCVREHYDLRDETVMLASALRRVNMREFLVLVQPAPETDVPVRHTSTGSESVRRFFLGDDAPKRNGPTDAPPPVLLDDR